MDEDGKIVVQFRRDTGDGKIKNPIAWLKPAGCERPKIYLFGLPVRVGDANPKRQITPDRELR